MPFFGVIWLSTHFTFTFHHLFSAVVVLAAASHKYTLLVKVSSSSEAAVSRQILLKFISKTPTALLLVLWSRFVLSTTAGGHTTTEAAAATESSHFPCNQNVASPDYFCGGAPILSTTYPPFSSLQSAIYIHTHLLTHTNTDDQSKLTTPGTAAAVLSD